MYKSYKKINEENITNFQGLMDIFKNTNDKTIDPKKGIINPDKDKNKKSQEKSKDIFLNEKDITNPKKEKTSHVEFNLENHREDLNKKVHFTENKDYFEGYKKYFKDKPDEKISTNKSARAATILFIQITVEGHS